MNSANLFNCMLAFITQFLSLLYIAFSLFVLLPLFLSLSLPISLSPLISFSLSLNIFVPSIYTTISPFSVCISSFSLFVSLSIFLHVFHIFLLSNCLSAFLSPSHQIYLFPSICTTAFPVLFFYLSVSLSLFWYLTFFQHDVSPIFLPSNYFGLVAEWVRPGPTQIKSLFQIHLLLQLCPWVGPF